MSRIRILSEDLANRIAAGEVIERPASVVKEFLENSIDAGAGHITVQVEGGGSRLIRVIDDGEGMDADDVLLCLERHATSKLSEASQLAAIRTLGFRGEAVPSIASVSQMTITSRPAGADLGVRAEIRFGRVGKVHEMGCARGTVMEVRDLFGNMPARKKFLKTVQTELSHIEEAVKNYALAYPQLGVSYRVGGREVFNLSAATHNLEARVRHLVCRGRCDGPLIRLGQEEGSAALRIQGYLLPPDQRGTGSAKLRLFVNGRVVRDRLVSHALSEGLRGFLMKGARPQGALFIELPPEAVDVNVHPTKQEVRFQRPNVIHEAVTNAAREGMERFQHSLKREVFVLPEWPRRSPVTRPRPTAAKSWGQGELPLSTRTAEPQQEAVISTGPVTAVTPPSPPDERPAESAAVATEAAVAPQPAWDDAVPLPHPEATAALPTGALRPVGQLLATYILCEADDGLVAIDQHAAHERLLFEKLKQQSAARGVARQALLFPSVIECGPEEVRILERFGDEISALGLDIEPFGGESYVVKTVPAIVASQGAEAIVRDVLTQLSTGGAAASSTARMEAVLASMACKAAIKAGHHLEPQEIEALLQQMQEADVFSHCPHGRPVLKHFSSSDIRRWFHRG